MVRQFLAVVVRAALQWALSSLLLANGAAFCLIAAAASWLRLGPPCLLCAGVHRLLCSFSADAGSQERAAFCRLLCDAHVAAITAAAASEQEKQQPEQQKMCSASDQIDIEKRDGAEAENSDKKRGTETHRVVSIGSEIGELDNAGDQRYAADDDDGGDDPYVSLFELAPIVARAPQDDGHGHVQEALDNLPAELRPDGPQTVGRLVAVLRAQRRELEAVRTELDGERRAGAEAVEYQRQLEEQGEFDREAVRLAMQLVHEAETEKHGLQRQLDACRVKAQLYEAATMDHATSPPVTRHDAEQQATAGVETNGDGGGNNYQSLVDFLPGSVFSSSPDLANLLKLYTEGNGGRRPRQGLTDATTPAVSVVAEEVEEEERVTVTAISGVDSNGNDDTATTITIAGDPNGNGDNATTVTIAGDPSQESSDHLESTEVSPVR